MLSLNNIEHEILRKEFADPRLHFTLVCASHSCPRLRSQAYTTEALERQLELQAENFLARPDAVHYTASENTIYLSSIFKWHRKDFGPSIINFIKPYLSAPIKDRLSKKTAIRWLPYDWSLNEQSCR